MSLEKNDGILIFSIGQSAISSELEKIEKELQTYLMQDEKNFILNLEKIQTLSSSELSSMITMKRKVNSAQGEMVVVACSEKILQIFEITMTNKLIKVYENLPLAIKSLKQGA